MGIGRAWVAHRALLEVPSATYKAVQASVHAPRVEGTLRRIADTGQAWASVGLAGRALVACRALEGWQAAARPFRWHDS